MPQVLAVDWDQHEARYVLASVHGETVQVRAAVTVPLVDVVEAGGQPHPDLDNSLRCALAEESLRGAVTLVGVDRGSVELLHFTVPPAADAELPELVSNQTIRESQTITEDCPLDFVPLDDDPARPRRITAAALLPGRLEQIRQTCAAAGLKPARVLLRPYGVASLFARAAPPADAPCLLVNLVGSEVDLTLIVDGKPAFLRTVRLPEAAEGHQATDRIVAEISRTLAVGLQDDLDADTAACVRVLGTADEHRDLIERIDEELSLPVEPFDPFEAAPVRCASPPENPGRFASLLGMVLDEAYGGAYAIAHGSAHAIDFLHPRRAPKPISRARIVALAVAAVAAIVLLVSYLSWSKLAAIDAQNDDLRGTLRRLNERVKGFDQDRLVAQGVRDWQAGDVIWLEELRELSIRLPADQNALILQMSMTPASTGGAITFQGLVGDALDVTRMEHQLRDPYHRVRSPSVSERGREDGYPWYFKTFVFVTKRDKSQYTSHLPPAEPVDSEVDPAGLKVTQDHAGRKGTGQPAPTQ